MDEDQKKRLKQSVSFDPHDLVTIIVTMLLLEWVTGHILVSAGEFWAYVFLLVVICARLGGIQSELKKLRMGPNVQV